MVTAQIKQASEKVYATKEKGRSKASMENGAQK